MDFLLVLHSHLPYVLNHDRWPHGSDWLCEAAVDTYLPLLEALQALEVEGVPSPITVGITPVLANQLDHPVFRTELTAFLAQRIAACDEAIAAFDQDGADRALIPIAQYWRGHLHRLDRLYRRLGGNLTGAFRHHADAGRIELLSSAATHGFLPLLARDESIMLQLAVGRSEHRRLFGRDPVGCWAPECAYRPRGDWHPHPAAPSIPDRPGIEEYLGDQGYQYFFVDAHLAAAGRTLGLYHERNLPQGFLVDDRLAPAVAVRSPYRVYQVSPRAGRPTVAALVRDPHSSRQVWSRYQGYPGDGSYLEFHKIRFPGGLKFWRVTGPNADLGDKLPYDPNIARARAHGHAAHYQWLLNTLASVERPQGGEVVVAPFDTELYGHWWFEGIDFLADLFRSLAKHHDWTVPAVASDHLRRQPPSAAVELIAGSWGADGDFSKWLNPETEWTWARLWPAEERFWRVARTAITDSSLHPALAQAARELLLLQSSDWQFIISTGTATDYAIKRFTGHAAALDLLLDGIEHQTSGVNDLAATLRVRDDVFPQVLDTVAAVLAARQPSSTPV
jgi:1,4-alpha-glucan branching enzyme